MGGGDGRGEAMALKWWNELAIRRVERGETRRLELRSEPLESMPERVWALDGLETLIIRRCPNLRLPLERGGLRGLRRLGWLDQDEAPLPDWAMALTLDLDWSDWLRYRDRLAPGQLRGLRIDRGDTPAAREWPEEPLSRLEVGRLDEASRAEIVYRAIEGSTHSLTALTLHDCERWPEWVTRCTHLRSLGVSGSRLASLPEGLYDLTELRELVWCFGRLRKLPASFDCWAQLTELDVGSNPLTALPPDLGRLRKLKTLVVWGNPLRALPESLAGHATLEVIHAGDSALETLPDWLFQLPRLQALELSRTHHAPKLRWSLPPAILDAGDLLHFRINPDNVIDPPPEVVSQGLDAIKAHIRQGREQGRDFLTEAKLLIIGEAGAGKTTLARRLLDARAPMPGDDESTEGIDVGRWRLDGLITAHGRSEMRPIDVNVWDFGGQEIYHSTHQFFLSRRSVYVLVADCRREDTDFYDWLRRIAFFGHDSPVLIVLNERSGRSQEIDIGRLRGQFPALVGAVTADLSTAGGIERVRGEVAKHLRGLAHLSEMLPKSWRVVRDELERLRRSGRDHISQQAYFELCSEHGFNSRDDMLVLSRFLHDIGVCLHFQAVPALMETVILEPTWATDAVYRVLDDKPIIAAQGRFDFAGARAVWHEARYDYKHGELLALMGQFELCYPLPGGQHYIAPQLLGVAQPGYTLPAEPGVSVRYRYDFMPKGIATRFIVAVHDLIADQAQVWRHGVVLRRDEAWGEVVEDHPLRQISVRVVGRDRQRLMGIVDHALERIHRRFEGLEYDTWVPCSCGCAASKQPSEFPVARLRKYALAGRRIQCDESFEMVDSQRLLDQVLPERARAV